MKESSVAATGPPAHRHDAFGRAIPSAAHVVTQGSIADNRAVDAARNLLRTLIFYDLFDVPLQLNELADRTFEGLPDSWRADPLAMIQSHVCLSRHVVIAKQYVFLQTTRPEFKRWEAAEQARRSAIRRYAPWVQLVCRLPFVRMVAISGSLAFPMSAGTSDCDLFIVTARNRLWITVAITRALFFRIFPKLRLIRCGEVCPNYMIDDTAAIKNGDLFDVMQLAAMNLVVGCKVYQKLITQDGDLKRYFPKWRPPERLIQPTRGVLSGVTRGLCEAVLEALPLESVNLHLFRRLGRRFGDVAGRQDGVRRGGEHAASVSSPWIRDVFDLTPQGFRFSLGKFKAHDGQKLALLLRYEKALREHPAAEAFDLLGTANATTVTGAAAQGGLRLET